MNKELNTSKHTKGMIYIRTKHPDGTDFKGIVLDNKKPFVIIQEIRSFEADGIIVIPKKWIRSIRDGKYEKCANEILHSNRTLDSFGDFEWYIDLKKLEEIIVYLKAEDIWPAVEVIYKSDASLYMGPITEVSKNSFKMYCYDACGKWEKEYELEYREIFKIEIDSRYVKHFNEYMRTKRKPA